MSRVWKKTENGTVVLRFCKNCGSELISTSKSEFCDDCRRTRGSNIRNIAMGVSAVVGSLLLIVLGGKRKL